MAGQRRQGRRSLTLGSMDPRSRRGAAALSRGADYGDAVRAEDGKVELRIHPNTRRRLRITRDGLLMTRLATVAKLTQLISPTPTQAQVQAIQDKINELISVAKASDFMET